MSQKFRVTCFDPKSGQSRDLVLIAEDEKSVIALVQQSGLLVTNIEGEQPPPPAARPVAKPTKPGRPPAPPPPPAVSPPLPGAPAGTAASPLGPDAGQGPPLAGPPPKQAKAPPGPQTPGQAPPPTLQPRPAQETTPTPPSPQPVAPVPLAPLAVEPLAPSPFESGSAESPQKGGLDSALLNQETTILSPQASQATVPSGLAKPAQSDQGTWNSSTPIPLGDVSWMASAQEPLSKRKKAKRKSPFVPEGDVVINVVPMLDMTFQLLFFFIITFRSPEGVEAQIPLTLPAPEGKTEVSKDSKEKNEKDLVPSLDTDVIVEIKSLNNPQFPGEMGEVEISGLTKEVLRPAPGKGLDEGRQEVFDQLKGVMDRLAMDLKKDNLSIRLRSDPGVKWERVIQVADVCRRAKFLGIRFEKPGGS